MRSLKTILLFIITATILSGCGIFGIHFKLKNLRKAGKYPEFTKADSLRGSLSRYRSCYDVKHYSLNIIVDDSKQYIKGYVDIHAVAVAAFDTLQIDLYQNMKLNAIEYQGKSLGFN